MPPYSLCIITNFKIVNRFDDHIMVTTGSILFTISSIIYKPLDSCIRWKLCERTPSVYGLGYSECLFCRTATYQPTGTIRDTCPCKVDQRPHILIGGVQQTSPAYAGTESSHKIMFPRQYSSESL